MKKIKMNDKKKINKEEAIEIAEEKIDKLKIELKQWKTILKATKCVGMFEGRD